MKYILKISIILVTLIFFACPKKPPEKTELAETPKPSAAVSQATNTAVAVSSVATVSAPTMPAVKAELPKDWLAKLLRQSNQVEYRKRNQNVWAQAEETSFFMKYDALQTKSSSFAEVIYKSGSALDIKENTLIIFDQDPGQKKKTEDRVIIKTGELTGKTNTELWIFTDSGLVQIKAKKGDAAKMAEAQIKIKDNRAVNVKVHRGSAEVIYKKDNEFTRIGVAENAEVTLKANTTLTTGLAVNEDKVRELATAQLKPAATAQADLVIEFPADNALVNDFEIETRGRLTGAGAKLLISGQLAELSQDGQFTKKINLQAGTNLVVFQIVRSDGTVKFIKRSVRYQPR